MSTFPHLLKRTQFATFDPAITRVYASTPHSSLRYGDFGLKYPVAREKGPRYIKVTKLDVGHLLGSNWQSAEPEARFIQAHGTGKTPWTSHSESTSYASRSRSTWLDDADPSRSSGESSTEEPEFMRNVNFMTPRAYRRYLQKIRQHRESFLRGKIQHLIPEVREKLVDEEERTYVNLASKGYMTEYDISEYQVALSEDTLKQSAGRIGGQIKSVPHRAYGAAYSKLPAIAPEHNTMFYHPGRALDPVTAGRVSPRHGVRNRNEGTNRPWVVSLGGVTGESRDASARATIDGVLQTGTDFTRENPTSGEGTYKINKAVIKAPPKVLNLRGKQRPLYNFDFDMTVQPVSSEYVASTGRVGTRAYAAVERPPMPSLTDLGSRRTRGGSESVMAHLRNAESAQAKVQERAQNNKAIQEILAKLIQRPAASKGGSK